MVKQLIVNLSVWIPVLIGCCFPGATSVLGCQRFGPDTVNPKFYTSPSEEYKIHVDPSDIYGRNEAAYRLTKNGAEVWSKTLPITVLEATVTDEGVLAGYGYSNGTDGFGTDDADRTLGTFNVLIVDSTGEIRCNDSKARESSRFLHTQPNPLARGVIGDSGNDRFVVRVADPDVKSRVQAMAWHWGITMHF